ncbi:hypothetical protein KIN20_016831 [Parelaphostrongylus tenuis]|uniref:Uncharacterized protein n=1 Tax=Parelaphostrongylus tenuis TaxID=148309 RepID=A0AAD5N1T3_PARTN|nr:hypothetical protein KIN20_016831 [Parelaphostrongylus tenuis]
MILCRLRAPIVRSITPTTAGEASATSLPINGRRQRVNFYRDTRHGRTVQSMLVPRRKETGVTMTKREFVTNMTKLSGPKKQNNLDLITALDDEPSSSALESATKLGVSHTTVLNLLHQLDFVQKKLSEKKKMKNI